VTQPLRRCPDQANPFVRCPQPGTILCGLSTATAAEGAFPMAPDFQPWITRIDPNYGQPAWSPWELANTPF